MKRPAGFADLWARKLELAKTQLFEDDLFGAPQRRAPVARNRSDHGPFDLEEFFDGKTGPTLESRGLTEDDDKPILRRIGGPTDLKMDWKSQGTFESGTVTTAKDPGEPNVTVKALTFPPREAGWGTVLIFSGVHGSEPEGVDLVNAFVDLLKAAALEKVTRKPYYTMVVVPELIDKSRRMADDPKTAQEENRYALDPSTATAPKKKLVEPNRNFPRPGESYDYVRQRGKNRKDKAELLGCDDAPLSGDLLISRMLPETRILVQLVEYYVPDYILSVHANHVSTAVRGDGPGIFVDPRGGFNEHTDAVYTTDGTYDDSRAKAMFDTAQAWLVGKLPLKTDDGKTELVHPLAGNLLNAAGQITKGTAPTFHYASSKHTCGSSLGTWAPVGDHARTVRKGIRTITIELPRYGAKGTKAQKEIMKMYARVLERDVLPLPAP